MRVNERVALERSDMFTNIKIPNCQPKELCTVAERIMNMCLSVGYACPVENSVTELDKMLTVDYWKTFDGLQDYARLPSSFREWYIKHATEPDMISRARRWLKAHRYIFYEPNVEERADKAESNFRNSQGG